MNDVNYVIDELHAAVERRDARHWLLWVALAFTTLNGLDLIATRHLLVHAQGYEANPVMAVIVLTWVGVVVKIGYPAWIGWRVMSRPRFNGGVYALCAWCAVLGAVVAWNVRLVIIR